MNDKNWWLTDSERATFTLDDMNSLFPIKPAANLYVNKYIRPGDLFKIKKNKFVDTSFMVHPDNLEDFNV